MGFKLSALNGNRLCIFTKKLQPSAGMNKITVIDQLSREVVIPFPPKRIVSLVPSQTELLHALALDSEVTGITKFCIHPAEWSNTKVRIGGTRQLKLDVIRKLHPDLILANKEENDADQVKALMQEFPVWVSDVHNLDSATDMIRRVGMIANRTDSAKEIADRIVQQFRHLLPPASPFEGDENTVLYLIWRRPWMTVGGDTFIHDMLGRCGLQNAFAAGRRYPQLSDDEIRAGNSRYVFLSSEPYPFREKHSAEIKNLLPQAKIMLVDGEMFSWYGSRLLQAAAYMAKLQEEIR